MRGRGRGAERDAKTPRDAQIPLPEAWFCIFPVARLTLGTPRLRGNLSSPQSALSVSYLISAGHPKLPGILHPTPIGHAQLPMHTYKQRAEPLLGPAFRTDSQTRPRLEDGLRFPLGDFPINTPGIKQGIGILLSPVPPSQLNKAPFSPTPICFPLHRTQDFPLVYFCRAASKAPADFGIFGAGPCTSAAPDLLQPGLNLC